MLDQATTSGTWLYSAASSIITWRCSSSFPLLLQEHTSARKHDGARDSRPSPQVLTDGRWKDQTCQVNMPCKFCNILRYSYTHLPWVRNSTQGNPTTEPLRGRGRANLARFIIRAVGPQAQHMDAVGLADHLPR